MHAAILYKLNEPLIIEELDIPDLQPGQVLVKIAYSGVCHSQLMEVRGKRGKDPHLPHMLGHEGSGRVIHVGEGVAKVKPGNKVVLGWIKGKGMDVPGPKYVKNGVVINAGGVTTFSDYSIVSENRCVQLPAGVPMDCAVLFGCEFPTGAGLVMNRIKPMKVSSVAVFGLGGIGLSALMALSLYDCSRVIGIDIEESKLRLADDFGATHTVNAARDNALERINLITDGKGVDYAIETAGLATSIEAAFQSVRKFGGLCVFASHPQFGDNIRLDPYDLICGKKIEGSWGGESNPNRDLPRFGKLFRYGKLPLEKLLDRTYTLEQINQALDDLENRKVIRPLIRMQTQE
ncbi:MAG: zinc-binding dehydrogenase [Candidatus Saganbacteria bacterium]|nr:zinc-binding dehydrogenase [Candidatus Saganbacteria bacterium]